MFGKSPHASRRLATVLLGLGAAVAAIGAGEAGSSSGPLRCEIDTMRNGGMVTLAATVHSELPLDGSYSFRVKSAAGGGGSNISQGGGFYAAPDAPATLGRVSLGGNAIYDATLEVKSGGLAVSCEERVGGAL